MYDRYNRYTGQFRGFAFVELSERSQAEQAISQLNHTTFDGHPIKVNETISQHDRDRGKGKGSCGGHNRY